MKATIVYSLTLSRLLLPAIVAGLCLFHEDPYNWTLWVSLVLIGISEATDFFDGFYARRWGVVSELGKVLDPHTDAIAHLIVYWTLAMLDRVWFIVFVVMASRDILVGLLRIELIKAKRNASAKISGKIKAGILGAGSMILMGGPIYWNDQIKPYIVGAVSVISMLAVIIALIHHLAGIWGILVHDPEDAA